MLKTRTVTLDHNRLPDIVDAALLKCKSNARWHNALEKAWRWLIEQDIVEMTEDGAVLVPSASEDDLIYQANGICTCPAYLNHTPAIPCWHRAAARLVELMLEQPASKAGEPLIQQRIALQEADDERAEMMRKRQAYEQALAAIDELYER
jgi:acetyl-CoA acetyltransferase